MKELASTEIVDLLSPYYPAASRSLAEDIRTYLALLLRWNRKISLTTITNPVDIVRFHFGESLFAAFALKMRNGRLADVGSGAGFPGIPLAMVVEGGCATLIEPNAKKTAFLFEVVRRLRISNVDVLRSRMEDVSQVEAFDFVCARAIGKHERLMRWARGKLSRKGRLVLFLGEGDTDEIRKRSEWNWELPIKIPGASHRFILPGEVRP